MITSKIKKNDADSSNTKDIERYKIIFKFIAAFEINVLDLCNVPNDDDNTKTHAEHIENLLKISHNLYAYD